MGAFLAAIVGLTVGWFGFAIMRDPMRLLWLAPGSEAYYQRLVLDKSGRISLRLLGALVSLFGLVILTARLGSSLRLRSFEAASNALLALLWILFFGAWFAGFVFGAVQLLRGQMENWFQVWKQSAELGPIAVFPARTPAMAKEARVFTIAFLLLVATAVSIGLWPR